MFEGWGEFFLLVGSAAAVLIGLIFVVVTLMQDQPRSSVLVGSKLYMAPIVLQVSFALVLSAAGLMPEITAREYAAVAGVVALWGLVRGVNSTVGIGRLSGADSPHWSDVWCYGVLPAAISLLLAGVALAFWCGLDWARDGVAAAIVAMLLVSIRNEWDLITWLAPRPDAKGASE